MSHAELKTAQIYLNIFTFFFFFLRDAYSELGSNRLETNCNSCSQRLEKCQILRKHLFGMLPKLTSKLVTVDSIMIGMKGASLKGYAFCKQGDYKVPHYCTKALKHFKTAGSELSCSQMITFSFSLPVTQNLDILQIKAVF